MASCLSIFALLFLATKSMLMRLVYVALGCLIFVVVVETGSRAALAVSFIGVLVAFWLAAKIKGARAIGLMFMLFILGSVLGVASWGIIGGRLTTTLGRFMTDQGLAGGRIDLWPRATRYILTTPIPDPQGWFFVVSQVPHQTYLSAGIAGGLAGLIGMVGLATASCLQGMRNVKFTTGTDRIWQSALFLTVLTIAISVCSITTLGHKFMWSMFAICSLRNIQKDHVAEMEAAAAGYYPS